MTDECLHCGKADYPPGLRRGGPNECRCGGSIYDGEQRFPPTDDEDRVRKIVERDLAFTLEQQRAP